MTMSHVKYTFSYIRLTNIILKEFYLPQKKIMYLFYWEKVNTLKSGKTTNVPKRKGNKLVNIQFVLGLSLLDVKELI